MKLSFVAIALVLFAASVASKDLSNEVSFQQKIKIISLMAQQQTLNRKTFSASNYLVLIHQIKSNTSNQDQHLQLKLTSPSINLCRLLAPSYSRLRPNLLLKPRPTAAILASSRRPSALHLRLLMP